MSANLCQKFVNGQQQWVVGKLPYQFRASEQYWNKANLKAARFFREARNPVNKRSA